MSTPNEAVQKRGAEYLELWNAKRISEYVTLAYATDACMIENGISYNGHDKIRELCENIQNDKFEMLSSEMSTISDDCVIQTILCTWNSKERNGKLTWKKIDGDWKIVIEEWK